MPFYFFLWNEVAIAHLAEHGITPSEFEEVVSHPDEVTTSHSSGLPLAKGFTSEGRFLICVYELIDFTDVLPVTAFEPD